MKNIILFIATLFFSVATYSEISVIVHPSNGDTFNKKIISKVFLGKIKKFPSGGEATPVNSKASSDDFVKVALNKTPSQFKSYWSKLIFTGKGVAPVSVDTDADVLALIKENPNMIGYVDSSAVTADVKVVGTF